MNYSPLKNQSLFWDTDPSKIDKEKNKEYIISRILESGNINDIKWLNKNYSKEEISRVVVNTGRISRKTAIFWKNVLDIKEEIKCLSNQYQQTQNRHWVL